MSQTFNGSFVSSDDVQTTMTGLIEDSLDALRTKFSGATVPGTPSTYQWWMDTTTNILKIYNGSLWLNVYDVGNQELVLSTGQVDASNIADAARKPTLIEGEDIGPATCSIKTPYTNGAELWLPEEVFTEIVGLGGTLGVIGVASPTWVPLLTGKVHIPLEVEELRVTAKLTTCNLSFVINGVRSSISTLTTGWSDEVILNVAAYHGYFNFTIEGRSTQSAPGPYGGVSAFVARWNDS